MEVICEAVHSSDVLSGRVWCANWHFSGGVLVSSGEDKSFKLWKLSSDPVRLQLLNVVRDDQKRTIRWVAYSPCGRYLASASFDASVIVYEFKDNDFEEITTLEGHESEIKCCQFSPSGEYLATCSRDKTVWVWQVGGADGHELDDFEVASILQTHTADVKFVAWHPNEDMLVSGGYDGTLAFYKSDGEDWVTTQKIDEAHRDTIWSGTFSGGENPRLVTCGADRTIKVWGESTDEPGEDGSKQWRLVAEYALADSQWPLYSISWSRQSGLIVTGGGDRLLRVFTFDEENKALVQHASLELDSEINSVAWNPCKLDGGDDNQRRSDIIAAACDDGRVVLVRMTEALLR